MGKAKEISVLYKEIKQQMKKLVCLCHDVESRAEDTEQVKREAYEQGLNDANYAIADDSYKKGLSDAWEAARKIGSNSMCGLKEVGFKFEPQSVGYNPSWYVVQNYSASECIEKIRQYEQKKDAEIRVGDEVKLKCVDVYAVYMGGVNGSDEYNVYLCFRDGSCGVHSRNEIERKTGRHFPEIAEVLQKLKESDNG